MKIEIVKIRVEMKPEENKKSVWLWKFMDWGKGTGIMIYNEQKSPTKIKQRDFFVLGMGLYEKGWRNV